MKDKTQLYATLAAIAGALLLVISIFLPFASAKSDYKEYLLENPDYGYIDEIDMSNKDAVNISLLEFIRIDTAAVEIGMAEETAIANMVAIIVLGAFGALTLLFAALRKAIPTIIFAVLSFGALQLVKFDFSDRGVLPSSTYDLGIAHILCYIGIILAIAGGVVLLVVKIKAKQSTQAPQSAQ